VAQIFISTRFHMQESLENTFATLAYQLKPFEKANQIQFLHKFWQQHSKDLPESALEIYSEALVNKFTTNTNDKLLYFMGIPLQARMLAEAFHEELIAFGQSGLEQPNFPESLSTLKLYQKFIQKKYEILFTEKTDSEQQFKDRLIKGFNKDHQDYALTLLFPEHAENFNITDPDATETKAYLIKIGLIQRMGKDINFVHRTFAEYFAAAYLVNQLTQEQDHTDYKKVRDLLLAEIFKDRYQVVYQFIEQQVAVSAHKRLKDHWKEIKDHRLFQPPLNKENTLTITSQNDKDTDEQAEVSANNTGPNEEKIEEIFKQFTSGGWRTTAIDPIMEKLKKSMKKTTDTSEINSFLSELTSFYNRTPSYNQRNAIAYYIKEATQHYLAQAHWQNKIIENDELPFLASFESIKRKDYVKIARLINKKDQAENLKRHFITENNADALISLKKIVPRIILKDSDMAKLFKEQGLVWLERQGIRLTVNFNKLTRQMAEDFNAILDVKNVNGGHTIYADKIFYGMLLPILNRLAAADTPLGYDPRAIIKIANCLIHFCNQHKVDLDCGTPQLKTLLKLIEEQLNSVSLVPDPHDSDNMATSISALVNLTKATGFTMLMDGKTLKLLDTRTEDYFTIHLKHNKKIIKLIKEKIAESNNESNCFFKECRKTVKQLLTSNISSYSPQHSIFKPIKNEQTSLMTASWAKKPGEAPF
jgi:hypothetical protein